MTRRETPAPRARARKAQPDVDAAAVGKAAFLDALRRTGVVLLACRAADVSRASAYRWRAEDETFRAAWLDAVEEHTDVLEAAAIHRALHGSHDRPPSDRLLEKLLAARRPAVYGDAVKVTHGGRVDGTTTVRVDPADPEVAAKARELAQLLAQRGRGADE